MDWDLGPEGIGVLLAMSLIFGAATQLALWRAATHRLWLIATAVYFACGVLVSEAWFGWATEEDLQPNIDGLSFDEVLLIATPLSFIVMFATWKLGKRALAQHPAPGGG
jgi:hypothetical protein